MTPTKTRKVLGVGILGPAFLLWSLKLAIRKLDAWDWFVTRMIPRWPVPAVVAASRLGDGWLYALFILYLIHTDQQELAGHVAACVVIAWGGSAAMKLTFRRRRPSEQLMERACGPVWHRDSVVGKAERKALLRYECLAARFTFPSQHSACAVAFALSCHPSWWPFAACVCLSRVLIGAHFVGDVAAGIAVGIAAGVWG